MPWINLTFRKGALSKSDQHALMAKLTDVLMWWEKVPDTPSARAIMKGWVYEVADDADYRAGSPGHDTPSYFLEIRIPAHRLDLLAKQGLIRDFTRVVLAADGSADARRVWVTIHELQAENWGIGGHTDWLRDYTSALDVVGELSAPQLTEEALHHWNVPRDTCRGGRSYRHGRQRRRPDIRRGRGHACCQYCAAAWRRH